MLAKRWISSLALVLFAVAPAFSQGPPVDLRLDVKVPFRFVVYGDTRFTDPIDTKASNASVRRKLVGAIAAAQPAFVSIAGDISYRGDDPGDWRVWDTETAVWWERGIPVYPALGNHDLDGDRKTALANYFQRFPTLKGSCYYSVRVGHLLMLVLDSSVAETAGTQGEWIVQKLDTIPADIDFVVIVLHHPPYTSSSDDAKRFGGGHSARAEEGALAQLLEDRQRNIRARFVVFSGHVHNYERHSHNAVTYFVTGGGGAHAYPIERTLSDPFQSKEINYHYLLVEVASGTMKVTMNRLELSNGRETWTQPDVVTINVPTTSAASASGNQR